MALCAVRRAGGCFWHTLYLPLLCEPVLRAGARLRGHRAREEELLLLRRQDPGEHGHRRPQGPVLLYGGRLRRVLHQGRVRRAAEQQLRHLHRHGRAGVRSGKQHLHHHRGLRQHPGQGSGHPGGRPADPGQRRACRGEGPQRVFGLRHPWGGGREHRGGAAGRPGAELHRHHATGLFPLRHL